MALPLIPATYTAIASLLARKGAVEATKKYGPKAVKEVQKITTKMKKKSKSRFDDVSESKKLNNKEVEQFLKEHGHKEGNPADLKRSGDSSYQIKINNKGKEQIIVSEKMGDKVTKKNFTNTSVKKIANWQGYAEGGTVKNSLLTDDRAMYKDGGIGIEALRKEAPEVVERMGYEEGGSLLADDMPMSMPQETEMVPDEAMEENYVDFVISQTLSEEEQEFLNEQLEGNDRLSVIFDQVIEAASEFTGDGPVEGPGTGVSDDIPARLSDGEFVFTAKAVEEIGEDVLMSMMKEAEASVDGRQELNEGGTAMLEQPEVDQFGKPVDADIVEDDIRKGMLSTNPRLR